ncbi:MAG: hypothetical protein CSA36_04805 [Draconibacterium sp.]|nr:MAG: hypothetical protein CSA36_04805 [Draconibacterium sp.]
MAKNKRHLLLFTLLLLPALLYGQFNNNTTSPYSRYGLGDLHDYAFGRTTAMGGAAIGSRYSKQINLANPASYNAIDSLGFMFEIGLNAKGSAFKTGLGTTTNNDINFQYLTMNFRVNNHVSAALGLTPFSDMGYNLLISDEVKNTGTVSNRYYGTGTISKAFFGLAVKPFEYFSIGANLNYSFGNLTRQTETVFNNRDDFYLLQQYKSTRVNSFGFQFGAQATIPLKEKQKIIIGAVYEHKPTLKAYASELTLKNLRVSTGNSNKFDQDTLAFSEEEKGVIEIPVTYGVGLSYMKENKFEINADYYHQAWGNAKFFGEKSTFLTDLNKFALGVEWIPEKFSIRNYAKRVAYRVGLSYKQTYLKIDKNAINDFGISFGVGLPVYRSNSTVDVAAIVGKRGTTNDNLVLENYARLNISFNIYDLWFMKRRFD